MAQTRESVSAGGRRVHTGGTERAMAQSTASELKQAETVSLKWGGLAQAVRAQEG